MAENTNYIGVAMGMDVSDLKAGLTEASKRIGEANADFRAASSSMEDWTKSTEGLQAKVKQLDSILASQKSKLAGLTAEYEKVAAEQGENSTAARNLYIRMQNQQAVVNTTERELNNYRETLKQAEEGTIDLEEVTLKNGKALSKMGDDADEAGSKLDGLKSIAGGVAAGIAAIGAAAIGAIGGFLSLAESTRETRANFNKLETGFTTAGHSAEDATKTYRELYGILGDEGQATEAAAHLALLAKNQEDLAAWTDIAAGVYSQFGASLPIENLTEAANETAKSGKLTGGLVDALVWAGVSEEEFQKKLDAASTEQERQALITETLNGLYSEQSDKFKELNADIIAAREADAELSQAMADLGAIAEPIMTTIKQGFADILKEVLVLVKDVDFAALGEAIKGAFQNFIDNILPKILDGLKWLIDNFDTIIAGVAGIGAAFVAWKVVSIVQGIVKAFKAWTLATQGQTIAQRLLNLAMNANPIGIIITLIAGLVTAFVTLWNKSETFRNFWKGLWEGIKNACSAAVEGIKKIISGIGAFFSGYKDVGLNLVKGIWSGISSGAKWLKDKITGFASDVSGWFKKTFKINSPSKLIEDEVGVYVGQAVVPSSPSALSKVKKQLGQFAGFVTDNLGGIKSGLSVGAGAYAGAGAYSTGGGSVAVDARQTIVFNGNLSRKKVIQQRNDNYVAVEMYLKGKGAIE